MPTQALLRQIAQLREEVRALSVRREVVRCPAPTLEMAREVLRILIDVGGVECDGTAIWWKGSSRNEGLRARNGRERERGLA